MSNRITICPIIARILAAGLAAAALSGCGAELAVTTAGVANLNATQAKQAQQQRARVLQGLEATQQAAAARAASSAAD
jgi:hypothetical protein